MKGTEAGARSFRFLTRRIFAREAGSYRSHRDVSLHFGLGKSRLMALASLIAGVVQSRTVNLEGSKNWVLLPG